MNPVSEKPGTVQQCEAKSHAGSFSELVREQRHRVHVATSEWVKHGGTRRDASAGRSLTLSDFRAHFVPERQ